MNTYAAVVVLYQPNDQVYENMQTYMEEVSCVYVLDNSTKPNVNLIDKIKLNLLKYLKLQKTNA